MKKQAIVAGMTILGALVAGTAPAAAQVRADKSEIHIYAGELFGDDLTSKEVSAQKPKLGDDLTYGVRYGYDFTESWGLEFSAGYSPNKAKRAPGGDTDFNLGTLDVDAVWHFTPKARIVGYLVAGAGYAISNLDHRIQGTVAGQPVSIGDDDSFSLNAGVGAKVFTTKSFMIRVEARYRYIDHLVSKFDTSLNTIETTAGVGWVF